ncbi:hypothetical protein BJ741DRAFT_37277 [Chytriomyces cf. hyalinus JEL632]|nr:hypothetical protein BJ741DRAFT_37277 [Chytriomyces cf. hyalinus JEL632]
MNQNSPPPPPNSAAASGTGTTSSAHAKPTTIPRRMHSNSASASLGVASKDSVTDPKRTTKTASKLVVFPPASPPLPPVSQPFHPAIPASHYPLSPSDGLGHNPQQQFHHPTSAQPDFSHSEFHQHNPQQPPQLQPFSSTGPRTEAERLSKEFRIHLPRVTCYCAADSYDIKAICSFLKTKHGVVGREYDECLYVSYEHRVAGGVNAYAQLMMKHTARVIMETAVQSHNSTLSALNLAEGLGSTGNFEKMEQPVIPASAVNGPAMEGVR